MAAARAPRGGRPRKQGWEEYPCYREHTFAGRQLASLDRLADAEHTSRAELVRESSISC